MPFSLNEERWRRLEALFHTGLELSVEARKPFVERETSDDADLRRQLEEMLAHAGSASDRIARAIGSVALQAVSGGDWIGRRVGPYRLVREIGRGGMGIVFEAWRDDAEYHKTVALKVAPEWRDLERLRERFRNERQILASLEHPNIARFLDGGTEGGVPYFAMEYVEGIPISAYCQERKPGLRERIELFRQVCAAVHYAHESLVVHRDLKPANILVGRDGAPKLLDFGIAKLLSPLPDEQTALTEARLWTPDYSSPEQIRGRAVTIRTDVYALGLILYEMLCGDRAQTADPSSPLALDRSICELEPPRASERAAARGDYALSRQLRGDLDQVVAMAIRKEPERRYGSAAALSADLERFQEGRPVEARPSTPAYRVGKWARRHRLGVGAGALLAASMIGGIVSTVHQARRAERRFQQVRNLANTFVFDVHDRIQYLPGATEARKAIVATALRYLENLRQEAGGDHSLLLELSAAYERIGDVQGMPIMSNLGDTQGALVSYRTAESMLTGLNAAGDARAQLPLASVEFKLGMLLRTLGNGTAARERYGQAREMIRRLAVRRPEDRKILDLACEVYAEITRFAADSGKPQEAREAAGEATVMARRLVALDPSSAESRDYLSAAQVSLGKAYLSSYQLESAVQNFRDALDIREQLVREQPENASYRRSLMLAYGNLGDALGPPWGYGLGDFAGAAEAFQKAMQAAEWLCQRDPADRKARLDLVSAQFRAGAVLLAQPGNTVAALTLLERSRAALTLLDKEDPANIRYRSTALFVNRKIGEGLAALGRNTEAARRLDAVRLEAETFRGGSFEVNSLSQGMLAAIALAKIRAQAGESSLSLVDHIANEIRKSPPQVLGNPWNRALVYADLGGLYLRMGKPEAAASWLEKSAQAWRDMKVAAALEPQRTKQLAAVEANLKKLRR